jgi:hypothetical protein
LLVLRCRSRSAHRDAFERGARAPIVERANAVDVAVANAVERSTGWESARETAIFGSDW